MAILTYAQAQAQVASVLGNSTDTDLLAEAANEINHAISELNMRDWEWLLTFEDIAVVAGTEDYTFTNSDMRKVYDVRLLGNKRALMPIDQRLWDRVSSDPATRGIPFGYTIIRTSTTVSKIRLIPPPASTDTARVRYYKLITTPSAGGTALDIVERYQPWILWQAKASILQNHGENSERSAYWQARADRFLAQMIEEDKYMPDHDQGMLPAAAASFRYPLDSVANILTEIDGF